MYGQLYEMDFLISCFEEMEPYLSERERATVLSNLVLSGMNEDGDLETVEDLLADAYLYAIEDTVDMHTTGVGDSWHYCINVKIHSLGLTKEQKSFIYGNLEEVLDHFWHTYIIPWADHREPPVYQKGRSGGWIYIDRPVVGEKGPANSAGCPSLENLQRAYEDVRAFRMEWNALLEEMKEALDGMIERGRTP